MNEPPRQTRSYLTQLFEAEGIHPRHDLGQNFLIDLNIIESIVREGAVTRDDVVLEVGPGTGSMTTSLAQQAGHVVSVELDRNMHRLASQATAPFQNVTLLNCDALENKNQLSAELLSAVSAQLAVSPDRRLKLIANLPYAAATPIVSNLVATELLWERMVITIQYELGLRMSAAPGGNHYGALAVWLQAQTRVRMVRKLGPTVFWPRPQVDSAVVRIDPDPQGRDQIADRRFFHDFIRRLFQQRRKRLRTVLVSIFQSELGKPRIDAILSDSGLTDTVRAEDLPVEALVQLANRLQSEITTLR
ncbi:MAG: 16S rRNA (adenine(1518)-N(6)/adenine(1519)-N(6))-dimethyltransferase RsmA [Planctomycetaceae bacterium]